MQKRMVRMVDHDGFGPEALRQIVDVSRETLDRLDRIVATLDVWRHRCNLVGPGEFERLWRRHILDSAQLLPLVPSSGRIVDLGSGAGFPALVLAAGLDPGAERIVMVEKSARKCAFLQAAIAAAELSALVVHARAETVGNIMATCVTARALAPLPRLLDYAEPWLARGAHGFFPKGRLWKEELAQARKSHKFTHDVIPGISGGDGVVLKISEASRVR